jgi:Fur family transcriptional regulator, ferric uptake regulator
MALQRKTKEHSDDAPLRALLEELGLRITAARLAVLGFILQSRRAVSHGDVETGLADRQIDRVTLYRTLDTLAEAGLLAKSIGSDRVARFVPIARGDHSHHAHFSCDRCGRLYCLPAKPPRPSQLPAGFEASTVELNVHGLCADCATHPSP